MSFTESAENKYFVRQFLKQLSQSNIDVSLDAEHLVPMRAE